MHTGTHTHTYINIYTHIIYWYSSVQNWPFYNLCYHEHLTVRCTHGRYLLTVGEICLKLVGTVLVGYLT